MPDVDATTHGDPVKAAADRVLGSAILRERADRLDRLATWISEFPEFGDQRCNRRAVSAAARFYDAWCAESVTREGANPLAAMLRPPSEAQRERAADIAENALRGVVDPSTSETTAAAIRAAGIRDATLPEARIVAEAVSLDATGPIWLCAELARCVHQDRAVASLVAIWERHVEYGYWPKRIEETLRLGRTRELARYRCAAVDAFFRALRDQLTSGDRHVSRAESPTQSGP
ncbi:MAG: hypothetical protein O7F76_01200 [Planctomycetota bacterium]|nr:hypothetical protein [Planctomycetota bacterium]